MKTLDFATILAGIGCIVLSVVLPATAPYLIPTGVGMIGAGIPQVSALASKLGKQP